MNNYQGPCRIVVSLVTEEEPPMLHAHSLTGKNASEDGMVTVQIGPDQGMTARWILNIKYFIFSASHHIVAILELDSHTHYPYIYCFALIFVYCWFLVWEENQTTQWKTFVAWEKTTFWNKLSSYISPAVLGFTLGLQKWKFDTKLSDIFSTNTILHYYFLGSLVSQILEYSMLQRRG